NALVILRPMRCTIRSNVRFREARPIQPGWKLTSGFGRRNKTPRIFPRMRPSSMCTGRKLLGGNPTESEESRYGKETSQDHPAVLTTRIYAPTSLAVRSTSLQHLLLRSRSTKQPASSSRRRRSGVLLGRRRHHSRWQRTGAVEGWRNSNRPQEYSSWLPQYGS